MLERAMETLRLVQNEHLAKEVTYRRGHESVLVRAVPGQAVFRSENGSGRWVRVQLRDFIVEDGQFTFFPESGDVIEFAGREYEVLAPAGEGAWRWSDPYHTAMRIHTKQIGGD